MAELETDLINFRTIGQESSKIFLDTTRSEDSFDEAILKVLDMMSGPRMLVVRNTMYPKDPVKIGASS